MDWYKRDIGAYRRQTARLKPLAHGAYTLLLDEYYAGQGPLPGDYIDLYRIAKAQTDAEKQCVKTVADQYFPLNGDGFRHNERADEEIANYRKRKVTNTASSRSRFDNRNDRHNDHRNDVRTDDQLDPQKEREIYKKKETAQLCCFIVDVETGEQCGKPSSFFNVHKTKGHCQEHGVP